jgi:heme/copper-type cytochrome/quinol oxidase subunit 4
MSNSHEEEKLWFGLLNPTYMWIWVALIVLTIVEVIIPEPGLIGLDAFPRNITILSLIGFALVKTVLVAAYYMHLVGEKPAIIPIACAPFLFSIFLTIGLFPYEDDVQVPARYQKDIKAPSAKEAKEKAHSALEKKANPASKLALFSQPKIENDTEQ